MSRRDEPSEFDRRDEQLKLEEREALIAKLQAEAEYLKTQSRFYPVVIASGAVLAIVAVFRLFL